MLIISHRGASAYAPEHTFAAWDLALEMGVDYIEQDLQMTADGVLVVMHDETLDRTARAGHAASPVTGHVASLTLAELRAFEVGSWFNDAYPERAQPAYAVQPIPTLEEVLIRYADRASFYIETKQPEEAPGMEEALLALLRRHGLLESAARDWRVLIQSFSEQSLRKVHALEPALPLIQLTGRRQPPHGTDVVMSRISEFAVGIGPSWQYVDERFAAAARRHCLELHPYTVNEPVVMQRLADYGVTGMFTDVPDVLLGLRPADEPRGPAATAEAAALYRRCRSMRR
jgi:glycerophosphoryl diester phosphodiesterase